MKTKKWLALAGLTILSAGILAACGTSNSSSTTDTDVEMSFPSEVTHDGDAIEGGVLNYAIVAPSSSTGLLIDELTENTVDSRFGGMVDEGMFGYDGERKLDDSGLAKAEFDTEANTVTVSLTGKDYKWSDGEPFTIDDYIFTIKAMADKGYTGVRFTDGFTEIIGMSDYVEGKASDISGLKKVDDYTVVIEYPQLTPSMMYAGGDVPAYVQPEHIYKDIPVADWEKSEYSRTAKIVGMGAFVIDSIIEGESITYKANPNYYKGQPKVDGVKMDIVSPDTIVSEIKAGNYDVAIMPSDQLESYTDLSNISLVGKLDSAYEYLQFRLGKYDEESGKNVMDAENKMSDVKLRQAIGYAIDTDAAGKSLYNGLYHGATSAIISFFGDLHDSELEGYYYNPDKANELLDEAGYKDVDGDGFREDPKGEELKISLAARTRTSANEALVQQYIEWWKEVGLNVELYTGRTIELNSFYDMIQASDENIDMFLGGWSTGYDPSPSGLYSETSKFNFSRFVSDENTTLLKAIDSEESFDEKKNIENFHAWQQYVFEQAFVIPTFENEIVTAVNKRVKYYDSYYGSESKGSDQAWEKVELIADKGIVAE